MDAIMRFLPFILIFAIFYFFMIAPQRKKQKQEKKFAEELKRGDRVVTKSGLHGKVIDMSEKQNTIVIETGAGKITFERSSVSMELSNQVNAPKIEKKK